MRNKLSLVLPRSKAGAGEVAFTVADVTAVKATHVEWARRGLTILQAPTQMDFGYTFVALDPDGQPPAGFRGRMNQTIT